MTAKLIYKTGGVAGSEIPLKRGLNRVGRNPENEVVLHDASISSFHCEISVSDIAIAVRDLGSTNGTFINLQKITKGIVQPTDVLTIGSVDFQVQMPDVHIAVPDQTQPESLGAAFLEDGTPACFTHRDVPATLRCAKCETWFCDACVREVKRLTGKSVMKFCPQCGTACEPMPLFIPARQKSFFGKLQETIRLVLKK